MTCAGLSRLERTRSGCFPRAHPPRARLAWPHHAHPLPVHTFVSSQDQNLALTVLHVPNALDSNAFTCPEV